MSHERRSESEETGRLEPFVEFVRLVDGGRVLFWSLLLTAGYMFLTANSFGADTRLFPRLTTGVVLLAGVARIFVMRFDVAATMAHTVSPDQRNARTAETTTADASPAERTTASSVDSRENTATALDTMLVLAALIASYIIAGYFVGLFWVTPLFVIAYLLYVGESYLRTLLLTALMTGVAYGFFVIMNIDIMTGVL